MFTTFSRSSNLYISYISFYVVFTSSAMGFGHWNCAVVGCNNSGKKLDEWSSAMCDLHNCKRNSDICYCEPSFRLYPFPSKTKRNESWLRWTRLVKRIGPKGELWKPKRSSRVCSDHFVKAKPSEENPDPVLNMGYQPKLKSKRKAPTDRSGLPVKRSKCTTTVTTSDF